MKTTTDPALELLSKIVPPGGRVMELGWGDCPAMEMLEGVSHYYHGTFMDSASHPSRRLFPAALDCVVAVRALQHLEAEEDYEAWLDAAVASLKPGGVLAVYDASPPDDEREILPGMAPRGFLPIFNRPEFDNVQGVAADYHGHWCAGLWLRDCAFEVPEPPLFEDRDGGPHVVGEMPDRVAVSAELLDPTSRRAYDAYGLSREGDKVSIECVNGAWLYRIVGWRRRGVEAVCELQASGGGEVRIQEEEQEDG